MIEKLKIFDHEIIKHKVPSNLYDDIELKSSVDKFLGDTKESDLRLLNMVEYKPNQAILFPMSVYHAPNVTQEWFKEIPRALLRITFYKKYETT